jgi:hypothetical protein
MNMFPKLSGNEVALLRAEKKRVMFWMKSLN